MSLRQFLTSRLFFLNLLLAAALIAVIISGTIWGLKIYTHHGITYEVPNLHGLTLNEAKQAVAKGKLELTIHDSIYQKDLRPGEIIDQVPKAGHRVKEGRVIYLTINSGKPEKVTLPKITDISFRQAQVLLDKCGLIVDSIIYEPSEFNDLVLAAYYDTTNVQEGDILPKGSHLILTVGQSRGNSTSILPDLRGLFYEEAKKALQQARLNPGIILYDQSVTTADDSLNARVWKQMPDSRYTREVHSGSSVDLWLTIDSLKLPQPEFN